MVIKWDHYDYETVAAATLVALNVSIITIPFSLVACILSGFLGPRSICRRLTAYFMHPCVMDLIRCVPIDVG